MKIAVHRSAHSAHIVLCSVLGVMISLHVLHNWLPLTAVEVTCHNWSIVGVVSGKSVFNLLVRARKQFNFFNARHVLTEVI
jgi:hypothetical protein